MPLADLVDDISGVCLPAAAGDALDVLRPLFSLQLASRLRHELPWLQRHAPKRFGRWLSFLRDSLDCLEPMFLARAFDDVPASLDIPIDPDGEDPRNAVARATDCIRYLIGLRNGPAIDALPIPPTCFAEAGTFYLPHLRLVIHGKGAPVMVIESAGNTKFTWMDGFALTLPKAGGVEIIQNGDSRFWTLPSIFGLPVFNQAPEIAKVVADLELCPHTQMQPGMARVAEGWNFLKQVWPAAFRAALRQLKGMIILRQREYTRSHSPLSLLGVIALSDCDPPKVGDLIVHESSHVRLNLMRQFDPLWEDREPSRRHESPWRQDPRPLWGLVLGVHAFLNVVLYYQRVSKWSGGNTAAERLVERQTAKVRSAWETARRFIKPTPLGELFFVELEKEVLSL